MCALACLEETAAVETSSFILRFCVSLRGQMNKFQILTDLFMFNSRNKTIHVGPFIMLITS